MSTHFYPRLPPYDSSPVRPSTAHSTIRAVTPSPPHSVPRPKSEHALGSTELATFARYVVKAEEGGFRNPPGNDEHGDELRRSGKMTSGQTWPTKSRSRSPEESDSTSPQKLRTASPKKTQMLEPLAVSPTVPQHATPSHPIEEEYDQEPPLTPTPMTREQKRNAYTPMSIHDQSVLHKPIENAPCPPSPGPASNKPVAAQTPTPTTTTTSPNPIATNTYTYNQTPISLSISPHDPPRISPASLSPPNRISTSLSATSARSKHSVFRTRGRDELERKKAAVEDDEGPFGRMKSVGDLVGERERVRRAGRRSEVGGKRWGKG